MDMTEAFWSGLKKLGFIAGTFILLIFIVSKSIGIYAEIYNKIISAKQNVNESVANLDTEYQRRYALVDNLVSIVKETKVFETYLVEVEKEIYVKTAEAKASATKMNIEVPDTINNKIKSENDLGHMLTNAMDKLMVMAQQYPQISDPKVKDRNSTFESLKQLRQELKDIEASILYQRQCLNEYTKAYNQTIQSFPSNIIASQMGAKELPFFNVLNEKAKEDVKISF